MIGAGVSGKTFSIKRVFEQVLIHPYNFVQFGLTQCSH